VTNASRWSEGIWRLFGLAPQSCEPTYDAWMATIHAQDRTAVAGAFDEATRNGKELNAEWRTLDTTGSERWLMLHGGPLRVANRAASHYMGLVIETTERRRAEQALRDNERRLNAIVDTAMEAIVSIDRDGRILSVNPAAQEMFGLAADEMLGRNVSLMMPDHYRSGHDSYIAAYLNGGEKNIIGKRRKVEGRRKDGAVFPLELTVSEATFNNELLFVGFMRDLSPIEEEKRRVNVLRDELFHVSRLNDMGEVVAGLAHEVGQPIAAILNYSAAHRRAMSLTGEPPEPDVVAKIEAQARRAGEILKRLRGFIEKRPTEWRVEAIQDLIDDALELAILHSRAHILRPPPDPEEAGLRVRVDRILIGQVLVNLLRNADEAVVDEPDPQIWIETAYVAPETLRVSVADNGAGVDPETVAELFSPFFSTKQLGMGVGLSIGKAIVESHGGAISYRANTPRGSIFEFTLPVFHGEGGDAGAAPGQD
jgi:two-component system sensor kinase FixL